MLCFIIVIRHRFLNWKAIKKIIKEWPHYDIIVRIIWIIRLFIRDFLRRIVHIFIFTEDQHFFNNLTKDIFMCINE